MVDIYVLAERDVRLDASADPADLLMVIRELAGEVEWWKKQAGIYRDRAGFDPAFAAGPKTGTVKICR